MWDGSWPRFLRWCLQSHICSYFRITAGFDFNVYVVVDIIVLVLLGSKFPGRLLLGSSSRGCRGANDHPQLALQVDAPAEDFPSTIPFKDRAPVCQHRSVFILFMFFTPTCGHEPLAGLIHRIGSALELPVRPGGPNERFSERPRRTLCISKKTLLGPYSPLPVACFRVLRQPVLTGFGKDNGARPEPYSWPHLILVLVPLRCSCIL